MPWSYKYDWSVYEKTPDRLAELYLNRLKTDRQEPSREYLDRLVDAHQQSIPFENLDTTLWNRSISLEPDRITEKILLKHRGGYCFELNGLFCILLKELGFCAVLAPCRQLRHSEPCPVPATHCCILVYLDGKTLFCDVGYGGLMPRGSIELTENVLQTVRNETFVFKKSHMMKMRPGYEENNCGWYDLICYRADQDKEWTPLIQMAPVYAYLSDFYGANLLRSTGDTRYGILHVSINTKNGYIDLTDHILTIKDGTIKTKYAVTEEELPKILDQYFHIGRQESQAC